MGLKIEPLERDETFYDLVTSTHAAIQHHLAYTPASKLIQHHGELGFEQKLAAIGRESYLAFAKTSDERNSPPPQESY